VILTVVRRTVRRRFVNHSQYTELGSQRNPLMIDWSKLWGLTIHQALLDIRMKTIDRVTEVMDQGTILDGNRFPLEEEVEFARSSMYRLDPRYAAGKGDWPWVKAANPLSVMRDAARSVYFSRPVIHGDHVYVVGLSSQNGWHLRLMRIALRTHAVTLLGKIVVTQPHSQSLARAAVIVLSPQVSGKHYYCATPHYGGILVFPLDGSDGRRIHMDNTPGMPTNLLADIAVADGKIFATSGEANTGESYVHWYDPEGAGWRVIASSRRAEAKTPLDYRTQYESGAVFDRARNRILFAIKLAYYPDHLARGWFQFDIETQEIRRISNFHGSPCLIQRTGKDKLLLTFAKSRGGVSNVLEFDMRSDSWKVIYARDERMAVKDLAMPPTAFKSQWNLWPPYAAVHDRLWAFFPFGRIRAGDETLHRVRVVEPRIQFYDERYRSFSDHLEYVPRHDTLVFGSQYSLWLFQVRAPEASESSSEPESDSPR
jgi:hypothetical protein